MVPLESRVANGTNSQSACRKQRSNIIEQEERNSAIMASIDTPSLSIFSRIQNLSLEEVNLEEEHSNLQDETRPSSMDTLSYLPTSDQPSSFLLIDGSEHLKVWAADQFTSRLGCDSTTRVKVVSIFGNTGDGKSHTMNRVFFSGREVFPESAQQDSCTLGVRVAFCPEEQVICLDTEGLLGASSRDHQRTRLLLKVLAISDLVLYRTRAERLHKDLFTFLGSASKAYTKHFSDALTRVGRDSFPECETQQDGIPTCSLGPAVLIFHETRHTQPLQPFDGADSPEEQLRRRFTQLTLDLNAFSSLRYVGQRTNGATTDFTPIKAAIQSELGNTAVRSARPVKLVLHALRLLNDKFSGQLQDDTLQLFPAEYFSCPVTCASCGQRCELSMGHLRDNAPHNCGPLCRFQHQFQNCEYLCATCHVNGHRQIVIPKMATANEQSSWFSIARYAWSGYVLECARCGVIYRSRQYWYGNKDPEQSVVRAEICHVWEGSNVVGTTGHNTARRVLDGVNQLSEAVASVGALPSRAFSSWVADQIAPKYWRPNREITVCHSCRSPFPTDATKHHCRACGEGFCEPCSSFSRPVPERGWGEASVRVCKGCLDPRATPAAGRFDGGEEVRVRKYGEAVVSTLSSMASVLEYPRELIKDSVRPDYWVPDADVKECHVCQCELPTAQQRAHHCRDCGQGVCQGCSSQSRPVPRRGWDMPVRVCDSCFKHD